jgi:molybdenum cofactor biosynthesis enzyme MoaA
MVFPEEHWVRLTRVCNERCFFCADERAFDGVVVPFPDIKRDLEAGRRLGLQRANLSGGEPTLHPHFSKAVRLARLLGYSDVRVTTNGRRLAAEKFFEEAVEAGLTSVTFSVHGHTASLHDAHTRAPGSFEQCVAALRRALAGGRLNVCVYTVVTKLNAPHVVEMHRFFNGLGVPSIGFLKAQPAFDAWNNRAMTYEETPTWNAAWELFERAGEKELAAEYRAQHEAMLGNLLRVSPFAVPLKRFAESGERPPCWGERCPHCTLNEFCRGVEARFRP